MSAPRRRAGAGGREAAERAPRLVGVARESLYSPGRFLDADRAILEATARACAARGARVDLVAADAGKDAFVGADLVFAMCQGPEGLAALRRLAAEGHVVVHEAEAIEACHRVRLLPRLAEAGLPRPEARLVHSGAPAREDLAWAEARAEAGVWVKRGDVHATQEGDVVRARGAGAVAAALADLARRGVERAVLEAHVPGRTVKFYAVRGGDFFRAYAEDGAPWEPVPAAWPRLAERAARALGLHVFGGDFVVTPEGDAVLVDVNDWPSFSRCRADAAEAIAAHLLHLAVRG